MPFFIEIKVFPSSGRQACVLDKSGMIKLYLKAPPEQGKANHELLRFLADTLGISRAHIEIVSGLTERKKRIKINVPLTKEEFYKAFGIEQNLTLFS